MTALATFLWIWIPGAIGTALVTGVWLASDPNEDPKVNAADFFAYIAVLFWPITWLLAIGHHYGERRTKGG